MQETVARDCRRILRDVRQATEAWQAVRDEAVPVLEGLQRYFSQCLSLQSPTAVHGRLADVEGLKVAAELRVQVEQDAEVLVRSVRGSITRGQAQRTAVLKACEEGRGLHDRHWKLFAESEVLPLATEWLNFLRLAAERAFEVHSGIANEFDVLTDDWRLEHVEKLLGLFADLAVEKWPVPPMMP